MQRAAPTGAPGGSEAPGPVEGGRKEVGGKPAEVFLSSVGGIDGADRCSGSPRDSFLGSLGISGSRFGSRLAVLLALLGVNCADRDQPAKDADAPVSQEPSADEDEGLERFLSSVDMTFSNTGVTIFGYLENPTFITAEVIGSDEVVKAARVVSVNGDFDFFILFPSDVQPGDEVVVRDAEGHAKKAVVPEAGVLPQMSGTGLDEAKFED